MLDPDSIESIQELDAREYHTYGSTLIISKTKEKYYVRETLDAIMNTKYVPNKQI